MRQKSNGKFILRTLASTVSLCIFGVITLWLGISVAKEAYRKHEVAQELSRLKLEITELEQRNSNFSALIHSLKDSETRELEAKRRLNLKKPGEEVAVILRDKNEEPRNIVETTDNDYNPDDDSEIRAQGRSIANPIKWWQYITSGKRD